ncbi:Peptidase S24/S26A/S26B/S26C [Pseudocohnilembus persalinus]|uniref:Peptidase S24/S26A/S26B/S26C n=1 Tax=Pseudocohnilembus persalinus TaxID=266149 RepID=A0A0V0QIQ1_PSEPJ|nr:Peptidase S24/S26A/S26B/S26C [Pseudocohnilembus persalinus]|eukprot:KRX02110.1 Peptidase S24/S26A/S26B/S26C [Pseudocohnilembus persalinus]
MSEKLLITPRIIKNAVLGFGVYITYKVSIPQLFGLVTVQDNEMSPTIEKGDKIIYSKFSSVLDLKNKIAAFYDTDREGILFRRVNGLPGDFIEKQQTKVIIVVPNGTFHIEKDKYNSQIQQLQNQQKQQEINKNVDINDGKKLQNEFFTDQKINQENHQDSDGLYDNVVIKGFGYSIDDLVYFLRRLVEIQKHVQINVSKQEIQQNRKFQKLVKQITHNLKIGNHKLYTNIGSLAHCFSELGVKDQDLWQQLINKIDRDEWNTNFKESVYALEAFSTYLQNSQEQEQIDYTFKKIERITKLTLWEVNMTYYKRITESLVRVNRAPDELFAKIEGHVLNNLSMDYEIETIIDILFAFSKAEKGSAKLYDALQYTIYKGHLFNKNPLLQGRLDLAFQGKLLSKLVEIYGKCSEREKSFTMSPDFRSMMHKYVTNKKTTYQLPDIINTFKHLQGFQYEDQKQIEQNIVQKIDKIETTDLQELIEFYEYFGDNIRNIIPQDKLDYLEQKVLNITYSDDAIHNPNLTLLAGKYFLQFNKNELIDSQMLLNHIERVLDKSFMKMNPQQIKDYMEFFQDNNIKLVDQKKYDDFLTIARFNNKFEGLFLDGKNKQKKKNPRLM